MPRFAILTHDFPFLHWDLLLENGNACRTWRLLAPPDSAKEIPAELLADHRLIYLDYEGPVPGERGTVSCWDRGAFEWQHHSSVFCEVVLTGTRWNGIVRMVLGERSWTCVRDIPFREQIDDL
jgi:hypothetical protein